MIVIIVLAIIMELYQWSNQSERLMCDPLSPAQSCDVTTRLVITGQVVV